MQRITPLIARMLAINPDLAAHAQKMTVEAAKQALQYDPANPDTPKNRVDFIAACLLHNIELRPGDVDLWFSQTPSDLVLIRYGALCCAACGYDYKKMEEGEGQPSGRAGYAVRAFGRIIQNTCPSCHPQFKQDRELAEGEWAKEEADIRSQEVD